MAYKVEIDRIARDINLSIQEEANGQYIQGTPEEVFSAIFEEVVKEQKV